MTNQSPLPRSSFQNRGQAGKLLAAKCAHWAGKNILVLALPRGGVPVGYEVAKKLGAPPDTLVVRKIGAPGNPEYGIGAIAPGGVVVFDQAALHLLGLAENDLAGALAEEKDELERRLTTYHSGQYSGGRPYDIVILVDDGLATGVSARAAIVSVRALRAPTELVLAVPVGAPDTVRQIAPLVDRFICLRQPENFLAVGEWFDSFTQLSDEQVMSYLECAR